MKRLLIALTLCFTGLTGYGETDSPGPADRPPARPFPAASTTNGMIRGKIRWTAARPDVPPLPVARVITDANNVIHMTRPNPHAPRITPDGRLAGALVFLRGPAPPDSPWPHHPVTVEYRDGGPIVRQGAAEPGVIGLVRKGDAVAFRNTEPRFQSARARGAAFFTITLPDERTARYRRFHQPGLVELSSAVGDVHIRGHLFVSEHPFCAVSDSEGGFVIRDIPPGNHELVVWHPNWNPASFERDPESLVRVRLAFQPPWQVSRWVAVTTGKTEEVTLDLPGR